MTWKQCAKCEAYFTESLEFKATFIFLDDGPEAVEEYLDEILGEYHEAGHRH